MRKITLFCLIICVALLWSGCALQKRVRRRTPAKNHRLSQAKKNVAVFKVSGLDKNAVPKIRSSVEKIDAVQKVQVDVKKGTVEVILKKNKTASVNQLKEAIKRAGYRVQKTLQEPLELGQFEKRMHNR